MSILSGAASRALSSLSMFVAASVAVASLGQAPSASAAEGDPPPVLGGQLFSTGAPVTVEVLAASAGLTSTLFLLDPEEKRIATNRDVGTTVTVGPYGRGEELVFGIRVSGNEFRMGPGGRNPDGKVHAVVDFDAVGCAVVGFEDLFGGGDADYDDNKFKFCGGIAPEEPVDPEEPPTPDPVGPPAAEAGADQSVPEGSTVTLDGSGSKASTRPALQTSEEIGTLPGGTSLAAKLRGLDSDGRVQGSVDIGTGPAAQNTSVAYVVDVSGSTASNGGQCGNPNGDRSSNTILDCELAAALKLHEEVVAAGNVDKVALIKFGTSASALDLDPTSAVATLVSPTADKDGDGVLDVVQAIRSVTGSGGTNFLPPSTMACQMLATTGSPHLVTAFLSDGEGSGRLSNALPCTPPVTFHAFAVGANSKCSKGSSGSRLQDMATLTGGSCTDVPVVDQLPDILPGVIASRITKASYTIDGGEPIDLTDQLGLPKEGPADLDVTFSLPDDLGVGSHQICLTVTGEDLGGVSSETTCSALVTTTGEVTYDWRLVTHTGPPIFLSSRTSAKPTFVVADDGRYVFELTVTDGTGGSATDRVVVEVTNVDPHLDITHGDSFAGGVTQLNGTLTDEGWLDTHSATVDWGDGTTDTVDVTTAGPGWGTFFGSHVYRKAGTFDVAVVLTDDDGGTVSRRLEKVDVATPVAVWANSQGARSLDWGGGAGAIQGRVHTNGELRVVGAPKMVEGPTTYAGSLAADVRKNTFTPAPVQAPVQDFPIHPRVADFRPDGLVAAEVGTAYHDMTSACVSGKWHGVQAQLESGVYYAPCDVQLNGSDIGGRVTIVAEGRIKIAGARPAFEPYRDGLLFLAGASGSKAVDISTSSSKFLGVVFAGSGEISVSGASNDFFCGVLGNTVSVTGTDVSVRGADCGRPTSTVSGPVVVPDLTSILEVDHDKALPSDELGYDVTVTNSGTTVVAPTLIGFENVGTARAMVTGYELVVERQDLATGVWVPVATSGDDAMDVHLRANAFAGVTYPTEGGAVGTTVEPGGWATWGAQAVVSLTPDEAIELLDPARTGAVRTRVDFTLSPNGVQARRLYTYGTDFAPRLREAGADAVDVAVTTVLPDGATTVLAGSDSAPQAELTPGESVTFERSWTVPVPAPRGRAESDAGYLGRLQALDNTKLNGAAYVVASGGVGRLVAPLQRVSTTRQVPVVGISTVGRDTVPVGTTQGYEVRLANSGSTEASSVVTKATAGTAELALTELPDVLEAGERATATTSYDAPAGSAGTVVLRSTATWKDARGNEYGATGSDLTVTRQRPAALSASLTDDLVEDVGNDGAVSPGDTVRYTLTVRNSGDVALSALSGTIPTPAGAVFVDGSVRTPDGGAGVLEDGALSFTLSDVAGHGSRRITFDAKVTDPFPTGSKALVAQGSVRASGIDAVKTDDPALPGDADPTRTTVTRPNPALAATLTGELAVDADGSGGLSAGDTLAYTLDVASVGTQTVTGIGVSVPVPDGTRVVAGSVKTTDGTVASSVEVNVGSLAAFQGATISFRLKLDDPLPAGTRSVTVRGTVTSDQLDPITTDDPMTVEDGDGTVIPIGGSGGSSEVPGPTVGDVTPKDGTRIAVPTPITTDLTAPDGETVTGWKVVLVDGEGTERVLGSGTGGEVSVGIDPTKLENGLYTVRIEATTSNGGTTTSTTGLVVDGSFKPGRLTTSFADHQVGLGGLPLQVVRSYDSFDKGNGDFGVGWRVDVADFRIQRTIPLGQGGWKADSDTCGLIFCTLRYTSKTPHMVSVVWPDGRTEVFDMVGVDGSTFFPGIARAKFEPRKNSGTTSTLTVEDDSIFFVGDNAHSGAFGSGPIFDPQVFTLTDVSGTKYVIDRANGLRKMTDRNGDSLTFTRDGVRSSLGKEIVFTRDGQDRITNITSPAGTTTYGYDHGDLVSSVDLAGVTTTYEYDGDHNLTNVVGPGGVSLGRTEYDADGRLVAWIDAEGNRTEMGTDLGANQERVTDPTGRLTTITTYDDAGRLVRSNEVYGGQNHVTEYEYDNNHNVVLRRDPLGREWHATYERGNVTSIELPSGARTTVKYNSFGAPVKWTDAAGYSTTYAWNGDGTLASIEDALGHRETYGYTDGRRIERIDRNGERWAWTYTAGGLVKTERDPLGNVITYEYDASGRRTAVIDQLGHRTEKSFDALGNLLIERDADGRTRENVYDELSRLVRTVDPSGAVVDRTFDALGNVVEVDNHVDLPAKFTYDRLRRETGRRIGDQAPRTLTYDGAGHELTSTDEVGRVTKHTYYADGSLHTTEDPSGGLTTFTYAPDGQVVTEKNALGHVTSYEYWITGQLKSVTNPLGHTTRYAYDGAGRRTITTLPDGSTQRQEYDAVGNLVKQEDQEGDATLFEYDAAGRLVAVVDGEGRRTESILDAAGRTVGTKWPGGGVSEREYTDAGLVRSDTTAEGVATTYTYDAAGRRATVTDELSNTWSTTYDALGRVVTQRDPREQGQGPATTTNQYDDAGNLRSTLDALGNRVVFGYDDAGQRTSVTDPRNATWTVVYGESGEVVKAVDPLGRSTVSSYDEAGQLVSTKDPRGTTVDRSYDAAGRLVAVQNRTGTGSIRYTYDALGRRTSMTDETGTTRWEYTLDGASRTVSSAAGEISYTYDRSGLRTSMVTPAGKVDYAYDPAGRLAAVEDWDDRTFEVVHDRDGRLRSLNRPNGVDTTWSYDNASRLTEVIHTRGSDVLDSAAYQLDADGNRTRMTTPEGVESYTLNALDQLTAVTYPGGRTTAYTYDEAGNRLTSRTGSEAPVTYAYDDASQLKSVGGAAVEHDAAGNLTRAQGARYDWDWLGRMVQVDGSAAPEGPITYTYDGDGVRVTQDSGDGTTPLLYDRATADGLPDLVRAEDQDFLHMVNGVVAVDGADTSYPLADGLGSLRTVTDASGTVTGSTKYGVFGAVTEQSGSTTPFGFVGAPQSGGLVHLNARDLVTDLGRFASTDPVRPGAPGVAGWNQYTYVGNNPTTLVDPTGAMAATYVQTLRPAIMVAPVLPALSFTVVKPIALTGAAIGTAALVAKTRVGPDETPKGEGPERDPLPLPPIPLPLPETVTKPRPQDCTINGDSWYNYWGPNSRPMGGDACLQGSMSGGTGAGYDPPGWVSGAGYHRGHIIARRLGGSGREPGSLFTQCAAVNSGKMRVFEGDVAKAVKAGETVYYVVALGYHGRTIPDTVSIFYAGSRGSAGTAILSNVC